MALLPIYKADMRVIEIEREMRKKTQEKIKNLHERLDTVEKKLDEHSDSSDNISGLDQQRSHGEDYTTPPPSCNQ